MRPTRLIKFAAVVGLFVLFARMRPVTRLLVWAVLFAIAAALAAAAPASAGQFTVQACQADRQNYSSHAFTPFATRGMNVRRACNPVGPGLRGLLVGNAVRRGRVPRGAQSRFVMQAPPGTSFTELDWSGQIRRRDCRYALQLYADGPGGPIPIKNVRASRHCPQAGRAQAAGFPKPQPYNISGATRIIQRAVCVGGNGSHFCSSRGSNYIRTYQATAVVADSSPPSVAIAQDNPFTEGAWVSGVQRVDYTASDNVGIKSAQIPGGVALSDDRACDFTQPIPCPNGPGGINVDTTKLSDGTQPLQVVAFDAADNPSPAAGVTVRVDNTPPGAVPVSLEGPDGWRSTNSFAASWQNPDEGDRAPIVAANWRICQAGTRCTTGNQQGQGVDRLTGLSVPGPGQWQLTMWRTDAAGNSQPANASPPVALRYDPDPPTLAFQSLPADDPTRVSVTVTEKVSGVAGGQIEISQEGSGSWQTLPTQLNATDLVAHIDDAQLPAGRYDLRAQASDLAGNVGVASGPQGVTLPLRIQSAMQAGAVRTTTVRKRVGRKGKRRSVRRRVTVLRPSARVHYGGHVMIAGLLSNREGQPLAGQPVQVIAAGANGDQILATLQTDGKGRYSYRAAGSASRTLGFVYAGTATILPVERQVRLVVPAAGTFHVSRKRVVNGGSVTFSGRVRSLPLPAIGKLVEIQARQPTGEWTPFRTVRTDARGRWHIRYRFRFTRCTTGYRLRADMPEETGYAFAEGHSSGRTVTVTGPQGRCG